MRALRLLAQLSLLAGAVLTLSGCLAVAATGAVVGTAVGVTGAAPSCAPPSIRAAGA